MRGACGSPPRECEGTVGEGGWGQVQLWQRVGVGAPGIRTGGGWVSTIWMAHEGVMLSEVSQTEGDICSHLDVDS